MSLILALETSTPLCGAALLEEEISLAEVALQRPRVHAERLTVLVEAVLDHGDRTLSDVDAVAVSEGPGSYTGLRIGASTAKGLAESRDLALVGVPSLAATAAASLGPARENDRVLVMRHARADEYFVAGYRVRRADDGQLYPETALPVRVVPSEELAETLATGGRGTCWLAGAREDWPEELKRTLDARPNFLLPGRTAPSASWTARLAVRRLRDGAIEEVETWVPAYGRPFETRSPTPLVDRLSEDS